MNTDTSLTSPKRIDILFTVSQYRNINNEIRGYLQMNTLRRIRTELGISQEKLAQRMDVSVGTIKNAENGRKVTYDTAMLMLSTVNAIRADRGLLSLTLEELGLKIY